jgi:hypothetical protein
VRLAIAKPSAVCYETPMNGRRLATGLLAVALFALWPCAHASPIDPTWIAGFWDDGDDDDVVILVTSMATAVDMKRVAARVGLVAASVPTLKPETSKAPTSSPAASRAPPFHA